MAKRLGGPEQRNHTLLAVATEQARQGDTEGAHRLVATVPTESWSRGDVTEFANALSKSGDFPGALAAIKTLPGSNDRAYAFAQLALDQAERKDSVATMTAILAMEDARLAGESVDPFVFELIVVTRGVLGDFPGARQVLFELSDEHSVWPLWNLTEQMVAAGNTEAALTLAHAQEFPHARACALLGIASGMLEPIEPADSGRH